MSNEPTLAGSDVIDDQGDKIGVAADVLFAASDGHPSWVRVDHGIFKSRHTLVPLRGSYRTLTGTLVVPFRKDVVRRAPMVRVPVALTHDLEDRLAGFYGLTQNP